MNRVAEIWYELDYYDNHGSVRAESAGPVKRRISEMSKPELIRFCLNINPTLSKLRKKANTTKGKTAKALVLAELKMREEEWAELIAIRDAD